MPEPRRASDPGVLQGPHTPTEILGRGEGARKSKTYLKDGEIASKLAEIERYGYATLVELFRQLHAREHTVAVEVENEDGETVIEHEPEILSDEELVQKYDCLRRWQLGHQAQVDHRASIEGFSVEKATAAPEEPTHGEDESSAGADTPTKTRSSNNGQKTNTRWQ